MRSVEHEERSLQAPGRGPADRHRLRRRHVRPVPGARNLCPRFAQGEEAAQGAGGRQRGRLHGRRGGRRRRTPPDEAPRGSRRRSAKARRGRGEKGGGGQKSRGGREKGGRSGEAEALAAQEVMPATLRGATPLSGPWSTTRWKSPAPKARSATSISPRAASSPNSTAPDIEARLWSRDDDRLCRSLGGDKRECFYLAVRLNDQLRKGALSALPERISALEEGEPIGLRRGRGRAERQIAARQRPGTPRLRPAARRQARRRMDAGPGRGRAQLCRRPSRCANAATTDRAATFFAPNGQVFEASRLARHTVSLWIGAWRRQGDLVCRELKSDTEQAPRAEECARARITDDRVEFVDAGPSWRSFLRSPWPDDEPDTAGPSAREPASPTGEVVLGARGRKTNAGSFTDLR